MRTLQIMKKLKFKKDYYLIFKSINIGKNSIKNKLKDFKKN